MRYLESTARLKRVGKALRPAADMQDLTILFVFFSDVGVCSRVCYSKNELLTSTSKCDTDQNIINTFLKAGIQL